MVSCNCLPGCCNSAVSLFARSKFGLRCSDTRPFGRTRGERQASAPIINTNGPSLDGSLHPQLSSSSHTLSFDLLLRSSRLATAPPVKMKFFTIATLFAAVALAAPGPEPALRTSRSALPTRPSRSEVAATAATATATARTTTTTTTTGATTTTTAGSTTTATATDSATAFAAAAPSSTTATGASASATAVAASTATAAVVASTTVAAATKCRQWLMWSGPKYSHAWMCAVALYIVSRSLTYENKLDGKMMAARRTCNSYSFCT